MTTNAFEAVLLMHADKAFGSIVLAKSCSHERRRFSIGHELGHFLIPTHLPRSDELFECTLADLHLTDTREKDRRRRIEAEANRFAAGLLMPPRSVRKAIASRWPDLDEIIRLAREFGVSKEAMARTYIDLRDEPVAVLILQHGLIVRLYRPADMPWIEPRAGDPVPPDSIANGHQLEPGELSDIQECEPDLWFDDRSAARVEQLTEQCLGQANGFTMLLLHAELVEA